MKENIILLSDLLGTKDSDWMEKFKRGLSNRYKLKFYDVRVLGGIDTTIEDENEIHKQFVTFGIRKAIKKLTELEPKMKPYIGCSIGGVIAWKAGLEGLKVESLTTLSSTRLRLENEKPNCPIKMYFGESDKFKPGAAWLDQMNCEYEIIKGKGHNFYKDEKIVTKIIDKLIA